MNDNIDLTKILKDCPKGWKLYSPILGEVDFLKIRNDLYAIVTIQDFHTTSFTKEGFYYADVDGECILFPSKDQRDWSKFTAPWYKKEIDTIECLEEQSKEEHVLKSSKYEDVRKFMKYIEKQLPNRRYDKYAFAKDLLVWLDKQGEQEEPQVYETEDGEIITYSETDGYKFADKIEPRFKVGDWLYANELNDYASLIKIVKIVDVFGEKRYKISRDYDSDLDLAEFDFIDKHYHLWTIEDAKDGDILAAHECYAIFKKIDGLNIKCYCTYHYLGFNPGLYRDTVQNKNAFLPATKEQHDAMMKAMNDAGYKWNAKTKTLEELSESKFDPKTLNPFDKVLVKMSNESFNTWYGDFVAEPSHAKNETPLILGAKEANMVIPYNDDTKHLVGTTDEAPEYYRYWED